MFCSSSGASIFKGPKNLTCIHKLNGKLHLNPPVLFWVFCFFFKLWNTVQGIIVLTAQTVGDVISLFFSIKLKLAVSLQAKLNFIKIIYTFLITLKKVPHATCASLWTASSSLFKVSLLLLYSWCGPDKIKLLEIGCSCNLIGWYRNCMSIDSDILK